MTERYTVDVLKKKIDNYFRNCKRKEEIPTRLNLIQYLDMFKEEYDKYRNYPDTSSLIKMTDEKIEAMIVHSFVNSENKRSVKQLEFLLECDFGYNRKKGELIDKQKQIESKDDWDEVFETINNMSDEEAKDLEGQI